MVKMYILRLLGFSMIMLALSSCDNETTAIFSEEHVFAYEIYSKIYSALFIDEMSYNQQLAFDISLTWRMDVYDIDGGTVDWLSGYSERRIIKIVDGYNVIAKEVFARNTTYEEIKHERTYYVFESDKILRISFVDVNHIEPHLQELAPVMSDEYEILLYFSLVNEFQTVVKDITGLRYASILPINPATLFDSTIGLPTLSIDEIVNVKIETSGEDGSRTIYMVLDESSISRRRLNAAYMEISLDPDGAPRSLKFVRNQPSISGESIIWSELIQTTEITFNAFNSDVQITLPEIASQFINSN